MPEVPNWIMGLVCLLALGLIFLFFVLVLLAVAVPRLPASEIEKDYDDGSRG